MKRACEGVGLQRRSVTVAGIFPTVTDRRYRGAENLSAQAWISGDIFTNDGQPRE